MGRLSLWTIVVVALALGGCNAIFGVDGLSYDPPAEASSSASGGAGTGGFGGVGEGGSGGGTTTTTGTGGMTTSAGGAGGGPPLTPLVRYFLDEQSSGSVTAPVLDSGTPPAVDLMPDGSAGIMTHVEENGNRGVSWANAGVDAGLRAGVDAKLIGALDGATSVTIETVFTIDDAVANGSRILHIGPPAQFDSRLNLRVFPNGTMEVNFQDPVGLFPYPLGQRTVMHVVIDSTEPLAEDRVRVYVGGALVAAMGAVSLPPGTTLGIPSTSIVNVGNRDCCRSPKGTISYVALYEDPLDEATVVAHAASLAVLDDGP